MPEGLKAVDTALDRVASRMTPVIQSRALEAGWPEDVASSISVIRTANGLGVRVEPAYEEVAADLEFGSTSNAPQSALATFHSPKTKQMVRQVAHNSMDELLERMKQVFS